MSCYGDLSTTTEVNTVVSNRIAFIAIKVQIKPKFNAGSSEGRNGPGGEVEPTVPTPSVNAHTD
jgi:hypothetical protein